MRLWSLKPSLNYVNKSAAAMRHPLMLTDVRPGKRLRGSASTSAAANEVEDGGGHAVHVLGNLADGTAAPQTAPAAHVATQLTIGCVVICPFSYLIGRWRWAMCQAVGGLRLRRSISPRGRDIDPEPRRRPPGRRFVLHRAFGPRIRYAALEPGPLRPLERDLLLLLRASTPISRKLPHPPPSPKPWPLSDLHFFSSDSPFGRLCLVCALSVCSLCRPHEAAQATAAAARTAERAAGGAETTAAACA